jgi:hypothetical protein
MKPTYSDPHTKPFTQITNLAQKRAVIPKI